MKAYDLAVGFYWRMPIWLQEMSLSAYAWHLDRLYFGPMFIESCRRFREHQFGDRGAIEAWQSEQLRGIVGQAAQHVPYYREVVGNGWRDVSRVADLPRLPILEKQRIRLHEQEFVDESLKQRLHVFKTSGTTGTSLGIRWDIGSLQRLWAATEVRVRGAVGVDRFTPRGMMGGRPIVRGTVREPPFWRFNRRWKQLYLSSYHVSRRWARAYAEAIRESGVVWLTGYGSAIAALAEDALAEGVEPIPLKVVIVSGDTLQPAMRKIIEQFFQCRCYDHYGQAEGVCSIMECPAGRMHVCPEFGVLEIVDGEGNPCRPGEVGDIVATTLLNQSMPLIRYRIGDQACWSMEEQCPCGSPFRMISSLEGRVDDYLVTPDGRRIGRLSTVMKRSPTIHSAQIVQDQPGHAYLLVRPGDGYQLPHALAVRDDVLDRIGRFELEILEVPEIPKTPVGKVKLVVRLEDQPAMRPTYMDLLKRHL